MEHVPVYEPSDDGESSQCTDHDTSFNNKDDENGYSDETDDDDVPEEMDLQFQSDVNYIVSWCALSTLLQFCIVCGTKAIVMKVVTHGSVLIVDLLYLRGHDSKWRSQKRINGIADSDLSLSAGILFSGKYLCTHQRDDDNCKY